MWVAFSAFPEVIRQMAWQISVEESFEGQPPEDLGTCGQCLDQMCVMVEV